MDKAYNVEMHIKNYASCPYSITVHAKNKELAVEKAKKRMVEVAYWGSLAQKPEQTKLDMLIVDSVDEEE